MLMSESQEVYIFFCCEKIKSGRTEKNKGRLKVDKK